jgi:hypothetical protein
MSKTRAKHPSKIASEMEYRIVRVNTVHHQFQLSSADWNVFGVCPTRAKKGR